MNPMLLLVSPMLFVWIWMPWLPMPEALSMSLPARKPATRHSL